MTSDDGITWEHSHGWPLKEGTFITHFARATAGDGYVAIIQGFQTAGSDPLATLATTTDLFNWNTVDFDIDVDQPNGLIYEPSITDVQAQVSEEDTSVQVLVSTHVEIDFGALLLSEGYTCGHQVTRTEVTVNLCNDTQLDVLSLLDIDELPAQNQMFVSTNGDPFQVEPLPWIEAVDHPITTSADLFTLPDQDGVPYELSADRVLWIATSSRFPIEVRAVARNADDDLVGVGRLDDGEIVIFSFDGATTTIPVAEIVGDVQPDIAAVVAAGAQRWVIYLNEPQVRGWILTSADGKAWQAVPTAAANTADPLVLVGDDEALLQWRDADDELITLAVPLPALG